MLNTWIVALLAVVLCVALIAGFSQRQSSTPHQEIGTALQVTPTAAPKPLSLALDLPSMSDSQRYWMHVVQAMPRCPICVGVDRPAIPFSDNEATIATALFYTECSFEPFDAYGNFKVNEIGARGCAQLMGDLVTTENMWNPLLNIYDGLVEFRRLIDANGGDVSESLRNYKGVASSDTTWQATSVFAVIRVGQ